MSFTREHLIKKKINADSDIKILPKESLESSVCNDSKKGQLLEKRRVALSAQINKFSDDLSKQLDANKNDQSGFGLYYSHNKTKQAE